MLADLNARRKADREAIAAVLVGIAERHGAKIERRDEPAFRGWHGQSIEFRFELNGVGASVDVNDLHGGDHDIISWYNEWPLDNWQCHDFRSGFVLDVKGGWQRPHHKATSCPRDWQGVADALDAGLAHAAAGTAFIIEEIAA